MEKCIAIIKSGPRKGKKCDAVKKVIDVVDNKEIPHCNRHRIKENEDVNILSKKLNNNLNIEEKKLDKSNKKMKIEDNILKEDDDENKEIDKDDGKNILNDLDKQLDKLFSEYGL